MQRSTRISRARGTEASERVKRGTGDSVERRSSQRALRLANLLAVLMERGEDGMAHGEFLAAPALQEMYNSDQGPFEQALRRDLAALTGLPARMLQRQSGAAEALREDARSRGALAWYNPAVERYNATSFASSLRLSAEALDALVALAHTLGGGTPLPGGEELFARLCSALPEEQRRAVDAAQGEGEQARWLTLELGIPRLEESHRETLRRVQQALRRRQLIAFDYRRSANALTHHDDDEVEGIRVDSAHCYVTVWCEEAQRFLDLRLDRIVAGSLRLHPRMARGRRRRGVTVRYWLAAAVAREGVTERLGEQSVEWQDTGDAVVSGQARGLFWARRLLLGYGEHARALEPPQLVAEIRREAERMAWLYAPPKERGAMDEKG